MRRLLACLLLLALLGSGAALAGRGDPQLSIEPRDRARAAAIVLRKSDLGPEYRMRPTAAGGASYCKAIDESDLTLTGRANSPIFDRTGELVAAQVDVYESIADAEASWARGTSNAGQQCLRAQLARQYLALGFRVSPLRRLEFPRVAPKTIAFRVFVQRETLRLTFDLVVLQRSRAQVELVFGSLATSPPRVLELRLSRVVAARMKTAMRGA